MKRLILVCGMFAASAAAPSVLAQVTVAVDWNHSWSFMHPMGALANRPVQNDADLDFTNTWYLAQADFLGQYDGPSFGLVPRQSGTAAATNSYDSGIGPGPLGYGTVDYAATAGAEFTALGTTLIQPAANNRHTGYFRTTFTVGAEGLGFPSLRYIMDDGAFVYIDGVLIARINIAAGLTDQYTTRAANTTGTEGAPVRQINLATPGAQSNGEVVVPVTSLSPGEHTLAVSAHNQNPATSTDICMALQLIGSSSCSVTVTPAGTVQFQNQSDDDAANDTFTRTYAITPGNVGSSLGWSADQAPFAGNYADLQPVVFGPYLVSGGDVTVTLSDTGSVAACSAVFTVAAPVACTLTATAPIIRRLENLPGIADDTFTVTTTLTAPTGGLHWNSDASPSSGTYGTPVTFGPFPVSGGAVTIQIHDQAHPTTCQVTVSGAPPARYAIGTVDLGSGPREVGSDPLIAPAVQWVNNVTNRTLRLNNGAAGDRVVESQWIDLSSAAGSGSLSISFTATETSTGTNFETTDTFSLELRRVVAGVTNSVFLTSLQDANTNGVMNGYTGVTNALHATAAANYNANKARDEFNAGLVDASGSFTNSFPFTVPLAEDVDRVKLIVRGRNDSANEIYFLSPLVITYASEPDTDLDGMPDAYETSVGTDPGRNDASEDLDGDGLSNGAEYRAGTHPNNPADVLTTGVIPSGAGDLEIRWPSKAGKTYGIFAGDGPSGPWTQVGANIPSAGDGTTSTVLNGATLGVNRRYYRVGVVSTL